MSRRDYSRRTLKILFARSGNTCAFPGCDVALTHDGAVADGDVLIGEIAHIVGLREGGARWRPGMAVSQLNDPENLIVLCPTHHTLVDDPNNARQFSEPVMRRMKADHERLFLKQAGGGVDAHREMVVEELTSSVLLVEALPAVLYSARSNVSGSSQVASRIRRKPSRVAPFFMHDGRVWSFWDLADLEGPFGSVVDCSTARSVSAHDAWRDPDLHRKYVTVLNKAMTGHLSTRGLIWDRQHRRYYFAAPSSGKEVTIPYVTRTGVNRALTVVRQERFRTGERKDVWWHYGIRLQFVQISDDSWCLSLRPEFHLTTDGLKSLPSRRIGRRITRRKSTLYNDRYLNLVHFWKWFLTGGGPRFVLNGGQPAIVSAQALEATIEWPGVALDDTLERELEPEETLISLAELADAVGGLDQWDGISA